MEQLGLSGTELARRLNIPANRINDIIRGRREVSADTEELRFGRYFGRTARSWLNARSGYSLSKTEAEAGLTIEQEVEPRPVG